MLNFPNYGTIPLLTLVAFIVGCFVAVITYFEIRSYIRAVRQPAVENYLGSTANEEAPNPISLVLGILASIAFLLPGSLGFSTQVAEIYSFRNINIADVESLRIYRAFDESSTDLKEVRVINDRSQINEGLGKLHRCSELYRDHESWTDGYRIQLVSRNGDKEHFISAFRNSTSRVGRSGVIPATTTDMGSNIGVYLCADFQEWVKANIDPLFATSP